MSNLESRITAEIAADRACHQMVRAMKDAGYVAFAEEFEEVKEKEDRWIFIVQDDCLGDGYTVGAFIKATSTSSADYAAAPIGDFETLAAATEAFNAA